MKFLVLLSLVIVSFSVFAGQMCPFRSHEIVSCHERRKVHISICEDSVGQLVMTYKHPARPEIELYPAEVRMEDFKTITFSRTDEPSEKFDLIINKTIGWRTRGFFYFVSEGVEAQLSLECSVRNF